MGSVRLNNSVYPHSFFFNSSLFGVSLDTTYTCTFCSSKILFVVGGLPTAGPMSKLQNISRQHYCQAGDSDFSDTGCLICQTQPIYLQTAKRQWCLGQTETLLLSEFLLYHCTMTSSNETEYFGCSVEQKFIFNPTVSVMTNY